MSASLAEIPIIDIDAHFTGPPDFWTRQAPATFKDVAPRVVTPDGGKPMWVVGDDLVLSPPGLCVIRPDGSKVYGKFSIENFEGMAPAASQLGARLAAMDELGLATDFPHPTSLYPSVREQVRASLGDFPARVQRKVLHDTAARVYQLPS